MKTIKLLLLSLCFLCIFATNVHAAGSVAVVSSSTLGDSDRVVTLLITGSASDGTVTAVSSDALYVDSGVTGKQTLTQFIKGYFWYATDVIPGTTAPTNGFTILVNDSNSIPLAQALLTTLSNAANTPKNMGLGANGYPKFKGPVTIQMTGNSVHSATATIILTLTR